MAEDRRVKTAVRRPQRRNLCVEINADADEASAASPGALSDEEWVDSATDSGSNTSGQSKQGRSGGMDHPRRLQDDNEDAQGLEVLVAPLERFEFDSWEDLESYLAEYTKGTHQSFRILTKNTVTAHNAKIRPTGSNKPLLPNEWVNYGKTYICTHSGTYKSRGKGKWKRLQSRAMECEAQINACVQVDDAKVPTFILRITSARLVHNHPVNKLTYNQYPHVRTALESDVVGTVNELRKAGAKKKRILKYIHDNTDLNPSTQDVSNLIRRLKAKENTASTSATRLKKWMKEFAKESGNVGRIFVDSVGEKTVATCITLQSRHMRELFDRFPEVLMIDATHGTNASKYKVFSLMAHDVFGKGQFVQHAVIQNERRPTLMTALEEFKRNNPSWAKIKCVLIDKDFTEMSVLKMVFPDAILLLCQFHVLKYFREEIASADCGFTTWQKHQLDGVVNLFVYAQNEQKYLKYRKHMRRIMSMGRGGEALRAGLGSRSTRLGTDSNELGEVGNELGTGIHLGVGTGELGSTAEGGNAEFPMHPFEVYFVKNWDSCRTMWCSLRWGTTQTTEPKPLGSS